jgi:aryl-alcohol dehydrogenase-like predicted oxidoreductase
MNSEIARRPLGSTGEMVSIIGLGGYHIGAQADEKESIAIIRTAIDNGMTFMDNCWDYNDGASEIRMGRALRDGYRQRAFLMTKLDGRDKKTARSQIEESLQRLQTDVIDLIQFHEVIQETDPGRIFAPGGAMEAVREAQSAGKVRYIGFTNHKSPYTLLKMLQLASDNGVRFDAVQMPLNVMDFHFDSFQKRVVPGLVEQGIGVIGMKPLSDHMILESNTLTAPECLRYAMSLPVSVTLTGCDSMKILQQALDVARNFTAISEAERTDMLERTAKAGSKGEYERYKTTDIHDATCRNPQWLDGSLKG